MSNFISRNPIASMVTYTITVIGATWVAFFFIYDENKENMHKAQVEQLEAQINSQAERIELLKYENTQRITRISQLESILNSIPNTVQYFEKQISSLTENLSDKNNSTKENIKTEILKKYTNSSPYLYSGQAFIDSKTGASVGINQINSNRKGNGTISLPNQEQEYFEDIPAGKKWYFKFNSKDYFIVISEINYIGDRYRIILKEK